MGFWAWFKTDGDKLCNFVSTAALALEGLGALTGQPAGHAVDLQPIVVQIALVAGVLATSAHQSFFPNSPKENPK